MRAPKFLVLLGLVFLFATTASARKVNMKINIGGGAVGDFSAEEEFLQFGEEAVKTRFRGKIEGGEKDSEVFETQRFSREEDLVIDVPVPDGIYTVTLLFAETWDGAFKAGKRVFDVYLGSKPAGVVKVTDSLDPFQAGGRAAPVRKKYRGIATYGGLTIALRPIKQNPQIAGIMISGFSYSEPLLDELPTVAGDLSEVEDFSILNSIGPRLPVDPSLLYDPSQNPKLAEETGTRDVDPGDTISPSLNTSPPGRTLMQDQRKPFGPGHESNAISRVQEPLVSPGSQAGYGQNSFSDRPASQLQTSLGSSIAFSDRPSPQIQTSSGIFPSLIPPMETARAAASTVGSSNFLADGKHKMLSNHNAGFPIGLRSEHPRHGRQLASIAAEGEVNAALIQGSPESNVPDQSPFGSSSDKLAPPDYLSHQTPVASSGREISDSSASSQSVGHQSRTHVTPANSAQDPTESVTFSSARSSVGDSPGTTNLNSGSRLTASSGSDQSLIKSALGLLNPGEHQRNSQANHLNSFPGALGSQEPPGQLSRGLVQGEFHPFPPSSFPGQQSSQQVSPRAEHTEQRNEVQLKVEAGKSNIQIRGMSRAGDGNHFDLTSASRRYEPQKENPYQRAALTSELQRSKMGQPVEGYPLYSVSQGIQSSALSHATGMPLSSVSGSASPLQKTQVGAQNPGDGTSGFTSKERDLAETVPYTVRPFIGSGEVQSRESRPSIEGEVRTDHQTISSRPMISASGDLISKSAASSRFQSSDSKTRPMMLPNVPSPGVHNGNGKLDGLCIHNSTHCSCGMVEQTAEAPEECLFVVDGKVNPMVCITRPCSGKVVCACAPGASTLCHRTVVKNILVREAATPVEGTEDPSVVACKREALEDGILILTPII